MKTSDRKAKKKSWLKSRWVDDSILDTYFESFNNNAKDSLSSVLFMGPKIVWFSLGCRIEQ